MGLRKVKKYFIAHIIARVVYLFAATIMCVGLIMLIILIINILLPYLRVVHYLPTVCTVASVIEANKEGCPTCPRANTTTRPCIQIFVGYANRDNEQKMAMLHLNEYNILSESQCSYSTCADYYWQNAVEVEKFKSEYGNQGQMYTCLYDPGGSRVIVHREHGEEAILHALLWPCISIGFGALLVMIFYCWVGCDIWGSRIATVMWEKSLKRIEMEHEVKRRTNNITVNNLNNKY